jgi:peptidyl-prolyl cis-trans isomerase D
MMKLLRSQSQTVLIVVLVVIAVGFLFYGNTGNLLTSAGGHVTNDYGKIDGEDVTVAELYDSVREMKNTLRMSGQDAELQRQGAPAEIASDAWSNLLLQHQADKWHINIGDDEVVDEIKSTPAFQENGAFSHDLYKKRLVDLQARLRIPPDTGVDPAAATATILENLYRDNLRRNAVHFALVGSVHASASDIKSQYDKIYAPLVVSYATLDPAQMPSVAPVAPEAVANEYKNNPTNPAYRTKEKRKVDYVLLTLTPDEMKLPDDKKADAKNALGQKALNFALSFQPDPSAAPGTPAPNLDFIAEAKKQGFTPATTGFFAEDEAPGTLPPSPSFNRTAFALSNDNPVSKVVETADGVAVLHLSEIQPSELRPLDEVKADIQKKLQADAQVKTAHAAAKLEAALLKGAVGHGGDFKAAAANFKLVSTTLPSFTLASVNGTDRVQEAVAYATLQLKPGEVSAPFDLPDGKVGIAHLDSRGEADPAGLADFEKKVRDDQEETLKRAVLNDWVLWKSRQIGTHPPADLPAFGSVE